MEKIKEIINTFEWAWQTKPRLFALGIIIGITSMYIIDSNKHKNNEENINELRNEIRKLKEENKQAQEDCIEQIKKVKEFLKYIAE